MFIQRIGGSVLGPALAVLVSGTALVPVLEADTGRTAVDLSTAIIQVAKRNIPAVVHIEVTEKQEMESPSGPFEDDPFFRRFFDLPRTPRKFRREVRGLGSGMIIDAQGNILTNHHVAGGATKIEVLLADGRRFSAKLVGTDSKTDLAVVRIAAKDALPHITFGDSDKVEVGEWVVAIGHPRGLDQTVTQGIISAKHRQGITDPSSYEDFLQTDAAINPGNSGGPLLNLQGEVVGVNAAIASQSGGFEGIGFTIPSNMAQYVARQLISRGRVERGWLGVSIQDLTPEAAASAKVRQRAGVMIAGVTKGSPADKAGLKQGDVVIAYQGREIANPPSFRNDVATTPAGTVAALTVMRQGNRLDLTLRVGSLQDEMKALSASVKERLGAAVRPVSPKEADQYGLNEGQGVIITWLDPKGPLAAAGLEVQDGILEIDGQDVAGVEGLSALITALQPKQRVTLLALDHRTGNAGYLQIRLP